MQNIFVIPTMQHGCHANLYWDAGSLETWRVNLASRRTFCYSQWLIKGKAEEENWEQIKMIYKRIHE